MILFDGWHTCPYVNDTQCRGLECTLTCIMYTEGYMAPNYPVPAIPDNHEYLARKLGTMSGTKWYELWEWSHMEWFITTLPTK